MGIQDKICGRWKHITHKACVVAEGYAQQCADVEETFSLVAPFETVKIILALAAICCDLFITFVKDI